MDIRKLTKLKEDVENIRREADKATGALDQILTQLKEEFGCTNLEKAEKLLEKLKVEEAEAKKILERRLKRFEEKWGEVLHAQD